jgi:hypothetical protein
MRLWVRRRERGKVIAVVFKGCSRQRDGGSDPPLLSGQATSPDEPFPWLCAVRTTR